MDFQPGELIPLGLRKWSSSLKRVDAGVLMAFDIPAGAVPQVVVCHDSAFSGGAHLAL